MATEDVIAYRLAAVRFGLKLGWGFTPLQGKVPRLRNWTHLPPADEERVLRWAREGNIGLRTGAVSGIFVIDADSGSDVSHLGLPETLTVETGGGGRHYYFALPGGISLGNTAGRLGPKIDTRGDGGQVVYPGSLHPDTGRMYRFVGVNLEL